MPASKPTQSPIRYALQSHRNAPPVDCRLSGLVPSPRYSAIAQALAVAVFRAIRIICWNLVCFTGLISMVVRYVESPILRLISIIGSPLLNVKRPELLAPALSARLCSPKAPHRYTAEHHTKHQFPQQYQTLRKHWDNDCGWYNATLWCQSHAPELSDRSPDPPLSNPSNSPLVNIGLPKSTAGGFSAPRFIPASNLSGCSRNFCNRLSLGDMKDALDSALTFLDLPTLSNPSRRRMMYPLVVGISRPTIGQNIDPQLDVSISTKLAAKPLHYIGLILLL